MDTAAGQEWRATSARVSVIAGAIAMAVLVLILLANQTRWLASLPGVGTHLQIEGRGLGLMVGPFAAVVGAVAGFLGRASRRRRAAVAGSWLSVVAFLGFAAAGFSLPYFTYVRGLAWSPDGTRIAYSQNEAGVWVVSADGSSEPAQLAADGSAPVWSPDGSTIAYTASGQNLQTEIWAARADSSSEPTQLAADGSAPAWSPDGSTIAYVATVAFDGIARGELWLMDADGGNPRQLMTLLSARDQEVQSPAWSPDGTQVAFVGVPLGEGVPSIWVVDTDGENLRQVTAEGAAPDWSTDGRQIAFSVPPRVGAWGTVWVIDAAGTGRTQVPCEAQGDPQWTPEGQIAVDCRDGMYLVNPDGTDRQVLLGAGEGKPLAVESTRALSPDGTRVAYATGAGTRTDLVVHTIDDSTQITLIH